MRGCVGVACEGSRRIGEGSGWAVWRWMSALQEGSRPGRALGGGRGSFVDEGKRGKNAQDRWAGPFDLPGILASRDDVLRGQRGDDTSETRWAGRRVRDCVLIWPGDPCRGVPSRRDSHLIQGARWARPDERGEAFEQTRARGAILELE